MIAAAQQLDVFAVDQSTLVQSADALGDGHAKKFGIREEPVRSVLSLVPESLLLLECDAICGHLQI